MLTKELIEKIHIKFNSKDNIKGFVCWDCDAEVKLKLEDFTEEQLSKLPITLDGKYTTICSSCIDKEDISG